MSVNFTPQCPLPLADHPKVLLAHGGGGRLTHTLIQSMFRSAFACEPLDQQHDAARLDLPTSQIAMTTDSYVVSPLSFPGGDIGKLAVYGTVNDLAMAGARPLHLSLAFILEEGLAIETLWQVVCSIKEAAAECGVTIVTGDTKVVERGSGDGVFINTTGIGCRNGGPSEPRPENIQAGDAILVSGDLGRHGVAILAAREGLDFTPPIRSDCACLYPAVDQLQQSGIALRCLRDLTRGGLSAALHELAEQSGCSFTLEETRIPVADPVRGAVEILGLDPLTLANEGRFVLIVPEDQADQALDVLRRDAHCERAARIGCVAEHEPRPRVMLRTAFGPKRPLEYPRGELLPRIC